MAIVTVDKNRYAVDFLYQWDINQVLEIRGLSLESVPEIHFSNYIMEKAIVRRATMDDTGVITVDIPNSLLQKPYKITAYVCIYEGDTFRSLYAVEVPVKARTRPSDYTIEDSDEEIYSFNALENKLENTLKLAIENYNNAKETYEKNRKDYSATVTEIQRVEKAVASSASNADRYQNNAKIYQNNSQTYANQAKSYSDQAKAYAEQARAGQINADWNQNDETQVNHVKNRTHWKEVLSEKGTILAETTIAFKMEMHTLNGVGTSNIKVGGEYVVDWNGEKYICTAYELNQSICLGNASLLAGSDDTGEPFAIEATSASASTIMKSTSTAESVTIKIESVEKIVYHTIDPSYIKDMYYDNSVVSLVEVLPLSTLTAVDVEEGMFSTFMGDFVVEEGKKYIVNWNGTEYEREGVAFSPPDSDLTAIFLGNLKFYGEADTGEPFMVCYMPGQGTMIADISCGTELTISIMCNDTVEDIKKIPNKFLNLDWTPSQIVEEKLAERTLSAGYYRNLLTLNDIKMGDKIRIYIGSQKYEYIAGITTDGSDEICYLGNKKLVAPNNPDIVDTGEPFVIMLTDSHFSIGFSDTNDHVVRIEAVTGYNKMPEEYFPEDLEGVIIRSSTEGSTKRFKITVNDSGTISATEVTE